MEEVANVEECIDQRREAGAGVCVRVRLHTDLLIEVGHAGICHGGEYGDGRILEPGTVVLRTEVETLQTEEVGEFLNVSEFRTVEFCVCRRACVLACVGVQGSEVAVLRNVGGTVDGGNTGNGRVQEALDQNQEARCDRQTDLIAARVLLAVQIGEQTV